MEKITKDAKIYGTVVVVGIIISVISMITFGEYLAGIILFAVSCLIGWLNENLRNLIQYLIKKYLQSEPKSKEEMRMEHSPRGVQQRAKSGRDSIQTEGDYVRGDKITKIYQNGKNSPKAQQAKTGEDGDLTQINVEGNGNIIRAHGGKTKEEKKPKREEKFDNLYQKGNTIRKRVESEDFKSWINEYKDWIKDIQIFLEHNTSSKELIVEFKNIDLKFNQDFSNINTYIRRSGRRTSSEIIEGRKQYIEKNYISRINEILSFLKKRQDYILGIFTR